METSKRQIARYSSSDPVSPGLPEYLATSHKFHNLYAVPGIKIRHKIRYNSGQWLTTCRMEKFRGFKSNRHIN